MPVPLGANRAQNVAVFMNDVLRDRKVWRDNREYVSLGVGWCIAYEIPIRSNHPPRLFARVTILVRRLESRSRHVRGGRPRHPMPKTQVNHLLHLYSTRAGVTSISQPTYSWWRA